MHLQKSLEALNEGDHGRELYGKVELEKNFHFKVNKLFLSHLLLLLGRKQANHTIEGG